MNEQQLKACREAYEAISPSMDLSWHVIGGYLDLETRTAYAGWQACWERHVPTFHHGSQERISLERLYNEEITVAKCIELIQERNVLPDVTDTNFHP